MAVNEDETLEEVTAHKSNITGGGGSNGDDLSVVEQLRRLGLENDDRKFQNLDSVHSHKSDLSALACHTSVQGNGSFNNSFDFNDSCASFASFGGGSDDGGKGDSKSSLNDDSAGDFAAHVNPPEQLAAEPIPTKRTLLMNRLPDSRLVRHASLRYTSLQLIEENDGD